MLQRAGEQTACSEPHFNTSLEINEEKAAAIQRYFLLYPLVLRPHCTNKAQGRTQLEETLHKGQGFSLIL